MLRKCYFNYKILNVLSRIRSDSHGIAICIVIAAFVRLRRGEMCAIVKAKTH